MRQPVGFGGFKEPSPLEEDEAGPARRLPRSGSPRDERGSRLAGRPGFGLWLQRASGLPDAASPDLAPSLPVQIRGAKPRGFLSHRTRRPVASMTTSPSSLVKGPMSGLARMSRTTSEGRHSRTPSGVTTKGRLIRMGWPASRRAGVVAQRQIPRPRPHRACPSGGSPRGP